MRSPRDRLEFIRLRECYRLAAGYILDAAEGADHFGAAGVHVRLDLENALQAGRVYRLRFEEALEEASS